MIAIDDLRKENQNILDLKSVLSELIGKEELLNNPVFCELLERFRSSVQSHLDHEDRTIYSELLNHDDKQINEVATHFLSNTHELKKLFSGFVKKWCGHSQNADHASFVKETSEIFNMIDKRIKTENDELFPIVMKL
jgi:hemerythrin-like domain-containing protein